MRKKYKIKKFRRINRGFTLVETLVAISIFSMSILALLSVLAQGISNTNYTKKKIIATYLAQEGIEYIRNMRDTFILYDIDHANSWVKFRNTIDKCGNPGNPKTCYFDDSNLDFNDPIMPITKISIESCGNSPCPTLLYDSSAGKYNYNSGVDSGFIRAIQVAYPANPNDEMNVSSTVVWTQGSGSYRIVFSENLFNWIE